MTGERQRIESIQPRVVMLPPVADMDLRPRGKITGGGVILDVQFRADFFRKPKFCSFRTDSAPALEDGTAALLERTAKNFLLSESPP